MSAPMQITPAQLQELLAALAQHGVAMTGQAEPTAAPSNSQPEPSGPSQTSEPVTPAGVKRKRENAEGGPKDVEEEEEEEEMEEKQKGSERLEQIDSGRSAKSRAAASIRSQLTEPVVLKITKPSGTVGPAHKSEAARQPAREPPSRKPDTRKFLVKLNPDQGPIAAAKSSALESIRWTDNNRARVMKMLDDPALKVFEGEDRCDYCQRYRAKMQPPDNMEYWPCVALPDSTRCAFCVVSHASCNFQQAGKTQGAGKPLTSSGGANPSAETAQSLAARQESDSLSPEPCVIIGPASVSSEVVILKVEPGQIPSQAPPGSSRATPAAPTSSFIPGTSTTPTPAIFHPGVSSMPSNRDAVGGRLGRQTRTFVSQMDHSLMTMGALCDEIKNTNDPEQLQEVLEDTLQGVRREMGVLENMLKSLIRE